MKKFLFIGIDFSKSKFDVTVLESIVQRGGVQACFANTETGYKAFLRWLAKQSEIKREDWRFCGEHTGLYSRRLSDFLARKGLFIWLENPLQIKTCSGIKRTKTDCFDLPMQGKSLRIADVRLSPTRLDAWIKVIISAIWLIKNSKFCFRYAP
jgi:hypothetical protein